MLIIHKKFRDSRTHSSRKSRPAALGQRAEGPWALAALAAWNLFEISRVKWRCKKNHNN